MGKCTNHKDKETNFLCMKHNIYLCEACLKCRDPKIHCKFRSSCPIWFMEKRGGKDIDETPDVKKKEYTVVFKPDNKEVLVSEGATLLDAALAGDIPLNASWNDKGSCGKCKLVLESGTGIYDNSPLLTRHEKEQNYVLACQAVIQSDVMSAE